MNQPFSIEFFLRGVLHCGKLWDPRITTEAEATAAKHNRIANKGSPLSLSQSQSHTHAHTLIKKACIRKSLNEIPFQCGLFTILIYSTGV